MSKSVDWELSRKAAEAIGTELKSCWHNAFMALSTCPELAGGLYVEGWAITLGGLVIEHGWIELDDRIVDPTAALWEEPRVTDYFPGLRFTLEEAREGMLTRSSTCKPGDLPIAWRFGWGGGDNPEYMQAQRKAWDFLSTSRKGRRAMPQITRYECFDCERVFHSLTGRCTYCGSKTTKPMPYTGGNPQHGRQATPQVVENRTLRYTVGERMG